jgi:hypothetical protein
MSVHASTAQAIQPKLAGPADFQTRIMPRGVDDVLHSPGEALDPATRAFMEPRFQHDFGQVRVHTDPKAARSAAALHAQAYTVGHDIVFADGQYAPRTGAGRSLMAHELTHVVQQHHARDESRTLGLNVDRTAEQEADAVAASMAQAAEVPGLMIRQRFAEPTVARQTKPQEFPGFTQGDYVTCGAAALVSALLIWDRERKDPNAPNTLLIAACNAVLVHMSDHKQSLIRSLDAISIKGTTGHGQQLYDEVFNSVTAVRDAARVPKAQITEDQYQTLGLALYVLHKNSSTGGLTPFQIKRLQETLGIGAIKTESGRSFDELLDRLSGLQPGQIAEVSWYSRGKAQKDGTAYFTPHAFLVGRFQRGPWFVSDQGAKPAVELEAPDLLSLKAAIRTNTQKQDSGIHTGSVPTQNIGGMQIEQLGAGGDIMILGDRSGIETKARDVVMKPGDFVAEVDASIFHEGSRIVAWDFVARAYSLADAQKELAGAGTGSGGVIVENPLGLFHVFKTSLVSDYTVMETKIDESDSASGKVTPGFKRYYHAWLQLRSATRTGSFFQVY